MEEGKISPLETRYLVLKVKMSLFWSQGLAFSTETYATIKNRLSLKHKKLSRKKGLALVLTLERCTYKAAL